MDRVRSRTSKAEVRDVVPQGYFADLNSDGSWDVREDGSYKGYSSPTRRKWLFEHQQRILHDFQWVYENNRVHLRQRFLGVRLGQDPFDMLVIQVGDGHSPAFVSSAAGSA